MRWPFIAIVLVVAGGYLFYKKAPVSENDIYANRLVYLKRDNKLFTGLLKIDNKASQLYESFCNGIPCGKHAEQQIGGSYVSRGEYITSEKLVATRKEFATDTIVVDLWQEGGDVPSDPYYLSVILLKNDAFFKNKNKLLSDSVKKLVDAALYDTQKLQYDYLRIEFADAVYNATRCCYKEYKVKNGQVIEEVPGYEEWQLKNGVMQQVIPKQ